MIKWFIYENIIVNLERKNEFHGIIANHIINELLRLLGKRCWISDDSSNEKYPVETADWEEMGQRDEVWWQSKAFKRCSNAELVKIGVFDGKWSSRIKSWYQKLKKLKLN